MTRILPLFAALLLSFGFASPAEACWPWCKKGAPSGATQEVELTVASRSPSAPTAIDTMQRWGVTDYEARTLFAIAYGNQDFTFGMDESYRRWLETIGDAYPIENGQFRTFSYVVDTGSFMRDPDWIRSTIDRSGTMTFAYREPSRERATLMGQRLGFSHENLQGMFARVILAYGGRTAITQINYNPSRGEYDFNRLRVRGVFGGVRLYNQLYRARDFEHGRLSAEFLGFMPRGVMRTGPRYYQVTYGPDPDQTGLPGRDSPFVRRGLPRQVPNDQQQDLGPELQFGGDPPNADTAVSNDKGIRGLDEEDDEKAEFLPVTTTSGQGTHETNPLISTVK